MDKIPEMSVLSTQFDVYALDDPPPEFFCIYPMMTSNCAAECVRGSTEFTASWKAACKADGLHTEALSFQGCQTNRGHYVQWAYPECLPERAAINAAACDFAYYWDG